MVTLLIMLGPAVADSANGKDVYKAFAVRMSLFVGVTLYAWMALVVLERWRLKPWRWRLRPFSIWRRSFDR
jgi:predicted Kef-type K+ transport protein